MFGRLCRRAEAAGDDDDDHGQNGKAAGGDEQAEYEATSRHDTIVDVSERREIAGMQSYLAPDEKVLVVARQSRVFPGATLIFTPDTVFCTDRRVIVRDPMMLGLREHLDYYRHRDIKTVRLVRGRFTSSLMFTVPGMGTAARSARGADNGVIKAIPHEKAQAIYKIVSEYGNSTTTANRRRRAGGGRD